MSVIAIIVEYCINKYSITEAAESIGVDKTPKYGIMRCSKLSIQWNIQESQLKPSKATCLEMVSREMHIFASLHEMESVNMNCIKNCVWIIIVRISAQGDTVQAKAQRRILNVAAC